MSLTSLSRLLALPPALRQTLATQPVLRTTICASTTAPASHSSRPHASYRQYATDASTAPSDSSRASSVNDNEVSHFNALASSWWDPHGSSRLLHLMNPLRHRFIRQCLASETVSHHDKLKYLDIGCGGGIFAESAARLQDTASVEAIDPTPQVISVAERHKRHDPLLLEPGRLTYRNIAIEQLPPPATSNEGFDVVSVFEVIEHIQQPAPFLESALRHLKPGGWLVGSTIARTATSWITTKLVAEDLMGIVPRGTHDWQQYINPRELKAWAQQQTVLDVDGKGWKAMGVVYVPGLGWKEVAGSEQWGNYFFAVRKKLT